MPAASPSVTRSRNSTIEDVDGGAAGPDPQLAVRVVGLGQLLRQVGILDDRQRPSTSTRLPSLSFGPSLGTILVDTSARPRDVLAEEHRVGDLHQRIVDLEVEDVPDAPAGAAGRAGRCRPAPSSVPPWPLGLVNSRPGALQQQLAGRQVEGRHRALAEEEHLARRQAEVVVLAKNASVSSSVAGLVMTRNGSGSP